MPVMQNATISRKEKSMPPSTAKPLSMDAAAAHSRKKYQVLWVNLSFIGEVLQQNLDCFKYYNTIFRRLCYNKENMIQNLRRDP